MKKAFNLTANVCIIVLMSLTFLHSFILIDQLRSDGLYHTPFNLTIAYLNNFFSFVTIFLSATDVINKSKKMSFALNTAIFLCVASAVVPVFLDSQFSKMTIFCSALCIIPFAFKITSFCIPQKSSERLNCGAEFNTYTVDGKIAEIKHLKELNVISEEQFANAIEEVIKQFIN